MSDEVPIQEVSDTSFWVAYYRARESARDDALFRDPLAKILVGERGRRISESLDGISRYTEWSVLMRTVIIDRLIEKLIRTEGVDAVVNLGAGLDTRPYRMDLSPDLKWVEVDFPSIIAHKDRTLAGERPKCELSRIGCDLSIGERRREVFVRAVPKARKVLVLTEGVLPYLSPEQVSELARDLSAQGRFAYWIAEYFSPRLYPHLKKMVRRLKMKSSPFRFYPPDWFGFFGKLGWEELETRYEGETAIELGRRQPLPAWVRLAYPLLTKRFRTELVRISGFSILRRSG